MSIFSITSSFASVNSLSGIDVNQTDNGYNIILKMNKSIKVQKIQQSDNNLMLLLNSTIPSDSVDIVYDNTADLENVIVQKKNADNTIIYIEGKNIKNSNIYTKDLTTGITKESNSNNSFLYITDYKLFLYCVFGFIFIFALLLFIRPKNKNTLKSKQLNSNKYSDINTLRKKNSVQNRYIPSINYNIKNPGISIPNDLVSSSYFDDEEQIRKVG